jgi:hypothetical protein
MIGKSGSKMGSLVALLVMRISDAGARILHDFPRQAQQSAAIKMKTAANRPPGRQARCVYACVLIALLPRRARSRSSRVSPNAPGRAPEGSLRK